MISDCSRSITTYLTLKDLPFLRVGPIDQAIKEKALGNAIDYGPDAENTCKKIIASGADPNPIDKAYGETVLHRRSKKQCSVS